MKILVINTGSSSIKYVLFEMEGQQVITKGQVDRLGDPSSSIAYSIFQNGEELKIKEVISNLDHVSGLEKIVAVLTDPKNNIIKDTTEVAAVGHRVVHGGETYSEATLITEEVKAKIRELIPLAPLHNPANLQGIEVAEKFFPKAAQVAAFDTAFHQTMPPKSYRYPLPNKYYEEDKIRAYGMHGTSHAYVSKQALKLIQKPANQSAIITIHLG
ncbi:MAG: acetate kinase, partial [Marinoscillum sp.]